MKLRILNEDIQAVKKYYPNIDDNTFMQLIQLDPTYRDGSNSVGKYGKWILNLFNKGNLSPEDFSEVTPLLNQFSTYRNRVPNKDLNSYKTLDDLASILADAVDDDSMLSDRQKLRFKKNVKAGRVKVSAEDDYDVVLDTPKFTVYVPNTHEASMKLGSGTEWCTAHENPDWYNKYTENGKKLYIIVEKKSGKKWQYSNKNGDFLNSSDKKFNIPGLMRKDEQLSKFFERFLGFDYFAFDGNYTYHGQHIPKDIKKLIKHLTIDETTFIRDAEFAKNNSIVSVDVSGSVERIGTRAFDFCKSLSSVTLNDGVAVIGSKAFTFCGSLESITIPDSVSIIGPYTFSSCSSLKTVRLSNNLRTISDCLFMDCSSLTDIKIPNSVTSIGVGSFRRCSSLDHLYIPDSVKRIDKRAFYGCGFKTISLPETLTAIDEATFYFCRDLTEVKIPNSVKLISNAAFAGCISLKKVFIGDQVTSIENDAFVTCDNLTIYTNNEYVVEYCKDNDIPVRPAKEFKKESVSASRHKLKIVEDTCCITSKTSYMDSGLDANGIYYFGKKPEKPMNWKDYKKKKVKLERIDSTMVKKLMESNEMFTTYLTVDSKSVPDSDGFMTDYTWYMRISGDYNEWRNWTKSRSGRNTTLGDIPDEFIDGYVFVFGDSDLYSPDDGDFDFECDTYEEAAEWFDDYHGFDDDYEDSYY